MATWTRPLRLKHYAGVQEAAIRGASGYFQTPPRVMAILGLLDVILSYFFRFSYYRLRLSMRESYQGCG